MTGTGKGWLTHLHFIHRTAAIGCTPNAAEAMLPGIEDAAEDGGRERVKRRLLRERGLELAA